MECEGKGVDGDGWEGVGKRKRGAGRVDIVEVTGGRAWVGEGGAGLVRPSWLLLLLLLLLLSSCSSSSEM